jgi:Na+-transporting NADH:ubiquinone oxidoreductase subunit B/electron transport complex protein RnfD
MNMIRKLLHNLAKNKLLRPFATIFETLEGILFGCNDVTPAAPHIRDNIEIKRYMSMVILALMPSVVASVVFFGFRVILIILVSYVAGGLVEVLFAVFRKREIEEGFLVTGLIFPMILPPTVPLWVVAVGIVFGVFFGKEVFGGTGRNIFNPALVGRLFITIAFPSIMSASWQAPFTDAITTATPLAAFKTAGEIAPYTDLLIGLVPGSMGELFRVGIIAGGIFLIATKVANWRIPLMYLLSVAFFSFFGNLFLPDQVGPPLFQLLSGSILFGALFMATDPVTSPVTVTGKFLFGIFAGFFTVLIRSFSGYTEGVMFSIILMNALTPLMDHLILSSKYKPKPAEKEAAQ